MMSTTITRLQPNIAKKSFRFMSTTQRESPAQYCLNLVRKNDFENYLCTLLLPSQIRTAAFAIRAFNVEVAMVEDKIKDKQIGLMRMKFWNNVVENVYENKPAKTPVALELHRVMKNHTLSKKHFKKLVDARDFKLTASKFLDLNSVEKYAESTVSPVYYLLLEANNQTDDLVRTFGSHVGKAQGIANLLRSVRYNASRETLVLPEDLMQMHNLTRAEVFRGEKVKSHNDKLKKVVSEIAEEAKNHVEKARQLKRHLKRKDKMIFLPLFVTNKYLKKLQSTGYNIYDNSLYQRNDFLALQLFGRRLINQPF